LHKKDYLPAWWSQILRLGNILCVKTAAKLTQHSICDKNCTRRLYQHEIWVFLIGCQSPAVCEFSTTAVSSRPFLVDSEICSRLRDRVQVLDPSYKTIWQGIKMSGNHQILEYVEKTLFDTLLTLEGYSVSHTTESSISAISRWSTIISFSKFIQCKRALILKKFDGVTWKTVLVIFQRFITSIRDFLLSRCRYVLQVRGLALRKDLRSSLRRVMLLVLCSVRIKAYFRHKSRRFSKVFIDFVENSSDFFFDKVHAFEPGVFQNVWCDFISAVDTGNMLSENFNIGINLAFELTTTTPSPSIKCDTLRYFMKTWSEACVF
jgi:hypothetical protein